MVLSADRHLEHSSNKFYPPQVGAEATLFRSDLVTKILGESACNCKAIVIEAQAGQGKSPLAHLIFFHFVVSGLYNDEALLLERTEELFIKKQDSLPLQARILIARNLGAGFAFFLFSLPKARTYAQFARELAEQHNIHNGIAAGRFICGYIETLSDNDHACLQEIELSAPLLQDPLVGVANKLTLRVLHINILCKSGDLIAFNHQLHLLRTHIDSLLIEQTLAAPFGYVWGTISA